MYFLGVDPGATGALVLIDGSRNVVASTQMFPTYLGVWNWLLTWAEPYPIYCCMERVSGYLPPRGKKKDGGDFAHGGQPGHKMFVFGKWVGAVEMALIAAGFEEGASLFMPTPNVWQRALGLRTRIKGEADNKWKGYLAEIARSIFPEAHITQKTGDAHLLAEYCLRTYGG